jgi:transketolase
MRIGIAADPIAQKWLANRYNQPEFNIFDYRVYAVCGDDCMMEGVASEAASLVRQTRSTTPQASGSGSCR